MGEKKCPDCPPGAPLWMVTFADLMALLLTLFVLILTFSELNVVRYKAIAASIRDAFAISQVNKMAGVIEIEGTFQRPLEDLPPLKSQIPVVTIEIPKDDSYEDFEVDETIPEEEQAEQVEEALQAALQEEIIDQDIQLERSGKEVTISFPSSIAFPSGSSAINQDFAAIIDQVAPIIKGSKGQVVVAGHTDNIPVAPGGAFSSNWDLSAGRATTVLQRLIEYHEMPQERLTVEGYGESRPLVANDSPENRAQNRRVEITLDMTREQADAFQNGGEADPESGGADAVIPLDGAEEPSSEIRPLPNVNEIFPLEEEADTAEDILDLPLEEDQPLSIGRQPGDG